MVRPTTPTIFWLLAALLALLLLLIHRNWFFSLAPLISGDWPYFFPAQLREWFPLHHLWITYDGLGRGISQGNFIFLFSLYGWLAKAGLHFEVIARLLFFIPVVVLAPYGAFLAARQLTGHNVAAILGAFVYSLNTYFLVIQGGHMHLCMAYALAPLAYYFALKPAPRAYFWMFAVLAVMALFDVRMTLVVGVFAAAIALWRKVKTRRDLWGYVRKMALGGLVLVLLHSFWLLPTIMTAGGPFSRDVFNQNALNWVTQADSLTLHHPFWSQYGVTDFIFQPTPFYMYLLPLIAFIPFALPGTRLRKELLFFGVAGVASIILLMQENSIFARLYHFAYYNIPMMSMFRESTKLFFVTAFCYSMLISLLVVELLRRRRTGWAAASSVAVLFALIVPALPYIGGLYVKAFQREPVSPAVQTINQLAAAQQQPGERTLWVSRTPKFAAASNLNPSVDALELGERFWSTYTDPFDGLSYLKQPAAPALLNFAGIRHVAVPADRVDSVYYHYNNTPSEHYRDVVDTLGLTKKADVRGSTVWHNNAPKPHMYMATDVIAADSVGVFSGIDTNPTAAYLFRDQHEALASRGTLQVIATNQEWNPFSPQHMRVHNGQVTTTLHPPAGQPLTLYTPDRKAATQGRSAFTAQPYAPGEPITDSSLALTNAYPGGAMEQSRAFRVSDCNNYDRSNAASNGISGSLVKDRTEGQTALRVTARSHMACFSKKIERFNKTASYFISFDYLYKSGPAPRIGLYPYNQEPLNRQIAVPIKQPGTWQTYQTIIRPHHFSDVMYLNIYLPTAKGQLSEVLFDNIRVYAMPRVPEAYLRTANPAVAATTVQAAEQTPSRHRLTIQGLHAPRLLVFSETYDPNWQLVVRRPGTVHRATPAAYIAGRHTGFTLPARHHVIANGFANGWWIDPAMLPAELQNADGAYEIVLEYMPGRWLVIGSGIGVATAAVCGGYALYNIRRVKGQPAGRWRWR